MVLINCTKYENYIRVGTTPNNLQAFPTPTGLHRALHDVDLDAYTDLLGYTNRNRVRDDVEDITLTYEILSDSDEMFILNAIHPEWFYVELTDKKTHTKKVHKMYASDKEWDTYHVVYDPTTQKWNEMTTAFTFSLVEE